MSKSKFVSDELETVDCGDGEWVKIPVVISYGDAEGLAEIKDEKNANTKMMLAFIKEWNFKDDSGQPVAFNAASLRRLDVMVAKIIVDALTPKLGGTKEEVKKKLEN